MLTMWYHFHDRGSASSARKLSISSNHPPLPTDHKQVIAAAAQRSGSSNGGPGSMGPPPLPSTFKSNPSFRPRTPSNQIPISPIRSGTTPRALHSSSGRAEIQSPIGTGRSRASSVTSFASEVDTRFNLRNGIMPHGLEAGTDPRMINAYNSDHDRRVSLEIHSQGRSWSDVRKPSPSLLLGSPLHENALLE